jgi:hypothetical protein
MDGQLRLVQLTRYTFPEHVLLHAECLQLYLGKGMDEALWWIHVSGSGSRELGIILAEWGIADYRLAVHLQHLL